MSWWIFGKKEEMPVMNTETPMEEEQIHVEAVDELPELQPKTLSPSTSPNFEVAKKTEPLFVRIDKFQEAKDNLANIEQKLSRMESILETLGEEKAKEDDEIANWREELREIRSNLSGIDQNLFNKVQF